MKRAFLLLLSAVSLMFASCGHEDDPTVIKGMIIHYTTTDGNPIVLPDESAFNVEIMEHTYGTIHFKDNLTEVGDWAFCDCTNLLTIQIPNSVTRIGTGAFFHCEALEEVTLSNRLTELGDSAFFGCFKLKSFKGKYATKDGRCLIVNGELRHFAQNGITEYTIPSEATVIGFEVFYSCTKLKSVHIHSKVTQIKDFAFYYCEGLKSVYCDAVNPPKLGESVFSNNDGGEVAIGCKIYVPSASVEQYKTAKNWSAYAKYIEAVKN